MKLLNEFNISQVVMCFLLSTVAVLMGMWKGIPGAVLVLALPLLFPVIMDLRIAFLLFLCVLPCLGEYDTSPLLSRLWLGFYALLVLAWGYRVIFHPYRITFNLFITTSFLVFILISLLSVITGVNLSDLPPITMFGYGYANYRVWEVFLTAFLMLFAMSAVDDATDLKRLSWVIVIPGIFYAVTLFFFGAEVEPGGIINRRQGFFPGPHTASTHMLFCTITAWALLKCSTKRSIKIFLIGCICLFLYTQFITNVRTNMALIPLLMLFALADEIGLRRLSILGFVATVLFFLAFPFFPTTIKENFLTIGLAVFSLIKGGDNLQQGGVDLSTFTMRFVDWQIGLNLFWEHPWVGVGAGKHFWIAKDTSHTNPFIHNYHIVVLAETGLIGFTAYVGMVGGSIISGLKTIHRAKKEGLDDLCYYTKGFVLSLIMVLLVFMFLPGTPEGERHLWVLIGLLAAGPHLITHNVLRQNIEMSKGDL